MHLWRATPLTSASRPELGAQEVEHAMVDGVSVYSVNSKDKNEFTEGVLTVTSHRLLWHKKDAIDETCRHLSMDCVSGVEATSNVFAMLKIKRPRVLLHVKEAETKHVLELAFRTGGRDVVQQKIHELLVKRVESFATNVVQTIATGGDPAAGPKHDRQASATSSGAFTQHAGVSGLVRRAEKESKRDHAAIDDAFSDLSALMSKAGDLVALAEKLQTASEKDTDGDETNDRQKKFRDMLLNAGIMSPVTRESHGAMYHEQLARQLADFLQLQIKDSPSQLIPVMDVYTLFNRARGTELISPDDLYRACLLLSDLDLGLHMIEYPSGVRVIQSDESSSEDAIAAIHAFVKGHPGSTSADVARALGMSVVVARSQLEAAEQGTLLCRDESYEGLRFYDNLFAQLDPMEVS